MKKFNDLVTAAYDELNAVHKRHMHAALMAAEFMRANALTDPEAVRWVWVRGDDGNEHFSHFEVEQPASVEAE